MNLTWNRVAARFSLPLLLIWTFCFSACQRQPTPATAAAETNAVTVTAEVRTTNATESVTTVVARPEKRFVVSFGLDRVLALQRHVFNLPLWQYLASLIFILLAFYFSKLLDFVVGTQLKRWAAKTRTKLDDLVIELIHGPIKIISFVILLHIGLQVFPWPDWIAKWISKGLLVVVACSVTYMAIKCIDVVVEYWRNRVRARDERNFNEQLFPVVSKSLKTFLLIVAILVTTQNLGLNITAMLASLSIGGLALGLAAQDTVANLFGAVAVFMDKPFKVGDRIKLESIDGVVETIGLRSTRVRSLDGFLITVPNKTMGNATITNVTRRPNIKTEMNIGITYDMPADKVKRALDIISSACRQHQMTEDFVVSFNKFADSALNIIVVHWSKAPDYKAYVQGLQEINLAIKQQFDSERIDFAFPTQTLYVKPMAEGHRSEFPLGFNRQRTQASLSLPRRAAAPASSGAGIRRDLKLPSAPKQPGVAGPGPGLVPPAVCATSLPESIREMFIHGPKMAGANAASALFRTPIASPDAMPPFASRLPVPLFCR